MIHISKTGDVIGSFDAPQGHGMDVDSKGFVYIGQDTVRKYDPKTRQGRRRDRARARDRRRRTSAEAVAQPARVPGQGGAGPVAGFITVPGGGGRGAPNPEATGQAGGTQRERSARSIRRPRR